ncbi:MAG: hypothetical protein M3328_03750, partial [Chloroflexota bacterium]|nr:hypothetical protein [Chloroflexota bacterium]
GKLDLDRSVHLVPAGAIIGDSTEQALASANAWLGSAEPPTEGGGIATRRLQDEEREVSHERVERQENGC